MSAAEWPRPPEEAPPPRPAKTSVRTRGTGRKKISGRSRDTSEPAEAPAPMAGFVAAAARAIDAATWPVAPVLWWQPELPLQIPASSSLRNERRHRVPAAGFLNLAEPPRCPAGVPAAVDRPALPDLPRKLPAGDLAPLGWDARTVANGAAQGDKR
jgi:hypothetical protein